MPRSMWKTTAVGAIALAMSACASPTGGLTALHFQSAQPAVASDAVQSALQAVVQKANAEQQQAFAQSDPTIMRDTATAAYYQELAKINQVMADNGVAGIELLKIEWGASSVNGTTAQVTAFETWRTTYADGTIDDQRARNDYTLVQANGGWEIQADVHPNEPSGGPGAAASGGGAPTGRGTPPNRPVPAGPGQSRNWSGYAAGGGNYTAVTGSWTVPQTQVTGSFGSDASWVGIGGVANRDLIQAGTDITVGGNGQVRYQAWVEMLPQGPHPLPVSVRPGDAVTVSIAEQSPDQWLVSFKNDTTGQTYQVTEQYQSSHSSAEWVEEAPAAGRRVVPLDNFGTVNFTGGSAVKDGKTVSIAQAGAESVTMIDGSGLPQAKPSALGADGASFSVSRVNADTAPAANPAPSAPSDQSPTNPRGRGRGQSGRNPFGRNPFGNGDPFGNGNPFAGQPAFGE